MFKWIQCHLATIITITAVVVIGLAIVLGV